MTREEEALLWSTHPNCREVCGKKVIIWNTSDGNNEMLLDLEQSFRRIIIVPDEEINNFNRKNNYKEIFGEKININIDKNNFYYSNLKNNKKP